MPPNIKDVSKHGLFVCLFVYCCYCLFSQCSHVEQLYMYGNRLQTLGPEIGKLGNLKTLGLSENQITHLPGRLFVEVVVVLLFMFIL